MYIFYIHATDSTQNHAKALANLHSSGVPFWAQSAIQTQGRGQRGRSWVSEPGNLFLTCCFPLPPAPQKIVPGQLSIRVGVVLASVLKNKYNVELKWPNDLLINGQKCGGVLIEIAEHIYIGIGINITSHPSDTPMPATHLHDHSLIDKEWLVEKITETINTQFLNTSDFSTDQQSWWDFAKDSVPFWNVHEPIDGQIIGIDTLGQLLIKANDGKVTSRHQTFDVNNLPFRSKK